MDTVDDGRLTEVVGHVGRQAVGDGPDRDVVGRADDAEGARVVGLDGRAGVDAGRVDDADRGGVGGGDGEGGGDGDDEEVEGEVDGDVVMSED